MWPSYGCLQIPHGLYDVANIILRARFACAFCIHLLGVSLGLVGTAWLACTHLGSRGQTEGHLGAGGITALQMLHLAAHCCAPHRHRHQLRNQPSSGIEDKQRAVSLPLLEAPWRLHSGMPRSPWFPTPQHHVVDLGLPFCPLSNPLTSPPCMSGWCGHGSRTYCWHSLY